MVQLGHMVVLVFAFGETVTLVSIVTISAYTPIRHHLPILYHQGITALPHEFWDKPLNYITSKAFTKTVTRAYAWEEGGEARAWDYVEGIGPCGEWLAHLWVSLVSSWSPDCRLQVTDHMCAFSFNAFLSSRSACCQEFPGQAALDASTQTDSSSLIFGSF